MCVVACVIITEFRTVYGHSTSAFYARKQLLLSAHLSHCNSVCLSVCLSVHLSHGWISQKRCKLGSPNLHNRLPGRLVSGTVKLFH